MRHRALDAAIGVGLAMLVISAIGQEMQPAGDDARHLRLAGQL